MNEIIKSCLGCATVVIGGFIIFVIVTTVCNLSSRVRYVNIPLDVPDSMGAQQPLSSSQPAVVVQQPLGEQPLRIVQRPSSIDDIRQYLTPAYKIWEEYETLKVDMSPAALKVKKERALQAEQERVLIAEKERVLKAEKERKMEEIEGRWEQHNNGNILGEYDVTFNNVTGEYEMSKHKSFIGTGGDKISNIRYDGITWSFDSDWGYKIGNFVLKKVDDNIFEGWADGDQRQRWVRRGTK